MSKNKEYIKTKDFYHKVPKRFYKSLIELGYTENLKNTTFNSIFKWLSKNYYFSLSVTERVKNMEIGNTVKVSGSYTLYKGFSYSVSYRGINSSVDYIFKTLYRLCCVVLENTISHCDIFKLGGITYYFKEISDKFHIDKSNLIELKEAYNEMSLDCRNPGSTIYQLTKKQILSLKTVKFFDSHQNKDRYFYLKKYEIDLFNRGVSFRGINIDGGFAFSSSGTSYKKNILIHCLKFQTK